MIGQIVQEIAQLRTHTADTTDRPPDRRFHQGMLESKTIGFVKPFANEHSQYKVWMDKFINAVSQIKQGARAPLESILKSAYRGESLDDVADVDPDLSEDLYATLFDKTEGESHNIVSNCLPGDGKSAL